MKDISFKQYRELNHLIQQAIFNRKKTYLFQGAEHAISDIEKDLFFLNVIMLPAILTVFIVKLTGLELFKNSLLNILAAAAISSLIVLPISYVISISLMKKI